MRSRTEISRKQEGNLGIFSWANPAAIGLKVNSSWSGLKEFLTILSSGYYHLDEVPCKIVFSEQQQPLNEFAAMMTNR